MNDPWNYLIDGRVAEALEYDYETGRAYVYPDSEIPEPDVIEIYETKPIRNPKAKKSRRWVARKAKNQPGYHRRRNPKNSARNPHKYDRDESGTLAASLWAERKVDAPVGLIASLESRCKIVRQLAGTIR